MHGGDGAPASWMAPDEAELWRGRTAKGLAGVSPVVLVLLAGTLLGTATLVVVAIEAGLHGAWPFVAGVAVVGALVLAQTLRDPVRELQRRRSTSFVVTSLRAVAVRNGSVLGEARPDAPVVLRHPRDERLGSAIFLPPNARLQDPPPERVYYDCELPWPSRTGREGPGEPSVLSFPDVPGVDGLAVALRHTGFAVTEAPAPHTAALVAASMGLVSLPGQGSIAPGGLRGWVRTRLLRTPARLESPLAPADAAARLAASLAPTRVWRSPFARSLASANQGSVTGWMVRARRWTPGSSVQWEFQGVLYARDRGTTLAGTVGPTQFVPFFFCAWALIVALVLIVGVTATVVQLAEGKGASALPAIFVPAFMLTVWGFIVETSYRVGAAGWHQLASWLASILDAPGPWLDTP